MTKQKLAKIETAALMIAFVAIIVDVCSLAVMLDKPVFQWSLRAFYIPVLVLESILYYRQMRREEEEYAKAKAAERKKRLDEQWQREYAAFLREVHNMHRD